MEISTELAGIISFPDRISLRLPTTTKMCCSKTRVIVAATLIRFTFVVLTATALLLTLSVGGGAEAALRSRAYYSIATAPHFVADTSAAAAAADDAATSYGGGGGGGDLGAGYKAFRNFIIQDDSSDPRQ